MCAGGMAGDCDTAGWHWIEMVALSKPATTMCTMCSQLSTPTVYPKKYARGFCFAVLCCGYALTDFPISIRLTSLALWQSNDCPSASKATLMNMDRYFMLIHYELLHNHNEAKHNKTVCIFLEIYCILRTFFLEMSYESIAKWILHHFSWQILAQTVSNVHIHIFILWQINGWFKQ